MIDDIKSMAIFVTVVEAKSFRGAAKRLGLSPSVVSNRVSKLEKQLGAALLYRSTRSLSLTQEGERLFAVAFDMVRAARKGLELFGSSAERKITSLRIAIPATMNAHPIVQKIAEYVADNPGVLINILSSDRESDLQKDGIDVSVRMGIFRDSDLRTRRIGEEQRIIVGAPAFLAKHKLPKKPEDLTEYDFISFSLVPDAVTLKKPGQKTYSLWGRTAAVTDSAETARALAIAAIGLSALPHCIVESDLAQNRLVHLLPDWTEQTLPINLAWPRNATLNNTTREFINFLTT